MFRKLHPNQPLPDYLLASHNKRDELSNIADIMQRLRESGVDVDSHPELAEQLGPTLLDHVRHKSGGMGSDSPANQLRELRRQMLANNPELYRQLGLEDSEKKGIKPGFTSNLGELQYSSEFAEGLLATKSQLNPKLSHISAFGTQSNPKDLGSKIAVKAHVLPFFCNTIEKKLNKKRKEIAFYQIKSKHYKSPQQGLIISSLEQILKNSCKRFFFDIMREGLLDDEYLNQKMTEFYKRNLLRILFNALKSHSQFQVVWIDQARETIKKSVVIDCFRRNAYFNRMERKADIFYASRLFNAWKRVSVEDHLQCEAMVQEFRDITEARLLEDVLREFKYNTLASKQERKREMEAVQQYQKVKIFRVFEYWKSLSSKRRKPVDFTRYKGMASIPVRVTQKRNLELLDGDVSKVVTYRHLATSYKLMHPAMKI